MPAEKISEMMEQQNSTDEDLQKQSNFDSNGLPEVLNEPISNLSTNELTNGLKRSLSNELKDNEKTKKIRLTENGSVDQLQVTTVSKENNVLQLLKKLESMNNTPINKKQSNVFNKIKNVSNEIKNVSNETKDVSNETKDVSNETKDVSNEIKDVNNEVKDVINEIKDVNNEIKDVNNEIKDVNNEIKDVNNEIKDVNNETNTSLNMINHNISNEIGDQDLKENSPNKETNSKDIGKDKEIETSSTNNIINECEFIGNSEEITRNGKNDLVEKDVITSETISDLNSSSDNLVIVENSEDEHDVAVVIDDSPVTKNISPVVNDLTATEHNLNNTNTMIAKVENIVNQKENDTQLLLENDLPNVKQNTNENQTIESLPDNNNTDANTKIVVSNQDCEIIDSDTELVNDVNDILNGVQDASNKDFPQLLKLFSKKKLTFHQFESFCTQKIIETMTERLHKGKVRSEIQLLKERESFWRNKYISLQKQIQELQHLLKVHKEELKVNENARPHLVTRTVGLQAVLSQKRGGIIQLPTKLVIPSPKPSNNIVNIIDDDDDDDDVTIVEAESTTEAPSSSNNINKTTTKMQSPPLNIVKQSEIVSQKAIPGAVIPPNPIFNDSDTIDLTGNDETENDETIDESTIIDLVEPSSPVKVIQQQSLRNLPAQLNGNLSKHFTYVKVPNQPTPSSSYIVRASTSISPQQTTVLNRDTINKSDPKSKNLNPFRISDVPRVNPLLVQPCTVTYTTQHVPVSHISGSLQPISAVPYTTHQLPVSGLPVSLSQASSGTSFTTCRLPISIHTIPSQTSFDRSLVESQQLQPPPLAIPLVISEHPAKVPEIPNQRNLASWKRLPSAPRVTLSRTLERTGPQALVVSWNMILNKTMAEIASYQIYAYQEVRSVPPRVDLWKKIGEVNALTLPMACSLSQFTKGERYHFIVRAIDVYTRAGPFSIPQTVFLN